MIETEAEMAVHFRIVKLVDQMFLSDAFRSRASPKFLYKKMRSVHTIQKRFSSMFHLKFFSPHAD